MKRKPPVALPFSIDSTSRTDVFDQLVGALRQATETGAYKAGEVLPTMQRLAAATGVSFGTARRAIEQLTDEGYVNPRPRVGSVVMPKKASLWKGHILFVYPDDDDTSWYVQTFSNAQRRAFAAAGYLYSAVPASRRRTGDFSQLEAMLRMPLDFVLVMYDSPGVVARLRQARLPYAGIRWGDSPTASSERIVRDDSRAAVASFVAHCREAGIRSVLEVGYRTPGAVWRAEELKTSGIEVRKLDVRRVPETEGVDSLEGGAVRTFLKLPKTELPDLILLDDDILAQGALTGLLARGVRIPEDVKVVTLANRGAGPVFSKPLTRFEVDAKAEGASVADYVVGVLTARNEPHPPVLSFRYVKGETF